MAAVAESPPHECDPLILMRLKRSDVTLRRQELEELCVGDSRVRNLPCAMAHLALVRDRRVVVPYRVRCGAKRKHHDPVRAPTALLKQAARRLRAGFGSGP